MSDMEGNASRARGRTLREAVEIQLGQGALEILLAAIMSGSSADCARIAAASFTAGGTETLNMPREAGHAGFERD